jgi:hypothetical protein
MSLFRGYVFPELSLWDVRRVLIFNPLCPWLRLWVLFWREQAVLFKGETRRKRLAIPMFLGKVE